MLQGQAARGALLAVLTNAELEVVERVLVDLLYALGQGEREVGQGAQVSPLVFTLLGSREALSLRQREHLPNSPHVPERRSRGAAPCTLRPAVSANAGPQGFARDSKTVWSL